MAGSKHDKGKMREIMDHIQRKVIEDYSKQYQARYQVLRVAEEFKVDNFTEGQKEDFDCYKELLYQDFKYLARFEDYNSLLNVLVDIEKNLDRCESILESADWHL